MGWGLDDRHILAVSRMLKDNNDIFFGGKIVIFCGDPRQTLPVIPESIKICCCQRIINKVPTNMGFCNKT